MVHRDLKPENILLSDKTVNAHILIADFGLGRFLKSQTQKMETVCGTHHYLAPELVRCDRGEISSYDRSVDVWGIGLIAFIMLFGFNPFLCAHPSTHPRPAILRPSLQPDVPQPATLRLQPATLHACRRDSNMQTHQAIVDCRYTFPKEDNVSSEAKDLIKHMMCLVSSE